MHAAALLLLSVGAASAVDSDPGTASQHSTGSFPAVGQRERVAYVGALGWEKLTATFIEPGADISNGTMTVASAEVRCSALPASPHAICRRL